MKKFKKWNLNSLSQAAGAMVTAEHDCDDNSLDQRVRW